MNTIYVASLLLVVVSIIANAYWQDAVRWEVERRRLKKANKEDCSEKARGYSDSAKILFRIACFLGALSLVAILMELHKFSFVLDSNDLLVFLVVVAILLFLFYAVTPRYFSPIAFHEKDECRDE